MDTFNDELDMYLTNFHMELVTFMRKYSPKFEKFTCAFKADWSTRRVGSRGGWYCKGPGVSYGMQPLIRSIKKGYHNEYASFKNDCVIGSFASNNWKIIATAISCHEIAHAAVAYLTKSNREKHGDIWKYYYALLRKEFVNSSITVSEHSHKTQKYSIAASTPEPLLVDDKSEFISYGKRYGFTKEHFGKSFMIGKNSYKISGWNPNARKYFVLITRHDGKGFSIEPLRVKNRLSVIGKW